MSRVTNLTETHIGQTYFIIHDLQTYNVTREEIDRIIPMRLVDIEYDPFGCKVYKFDDPLGEESDKLVSFEGLPCYVFKTIDAAFAALYDFVSNKVNITIDKFTIADRNNYIIDDEVKEIFKKSQQERPEEWI